MLRYFKSCTEVQDLVIFVIAFCMWLLHDILISYSINCAIILHENWHEIFTFADCKQYITLFEILQWTAIFVISFYVLAEYYKLRSHSKFYSSTCHRICSGQNCLMSQGYKLLQPYQLATTNLKFLTEPTDTFVLSWSHNEKFILGLTSISTHHKVLKTKVSQTFNTPLFVFQATNIYHDHYVAFPFYNFVNDFFPNINVLSLSIQILFSSSLDEKLWGIEIWRSWEGTRGRNLIIIETRESEPCLGQTDLPAFTIYMTKRRSRLCSSRRSVSWLCDPPILPEYEIVLVKVPTPTQAPS